jgi:2-polyprenyl-6-methoxyphenol hydroxylase-like FAD-dependent oxidoreductase
MQTVLVVGAGIAGLAAARALSKRDMDVVVVERSHDGRPDGTGIYLPGNGGAALERLGVTDRDRCARIRRRLLYWADGRPVGDVAVTRAWGDDQPCFGFHRQDLHELLSDGLDEVDVRLGTSFDRLEAVGEAVEVHLTDGTDRRFDLVIGADGIHSQVRSHVLGEVPVRRVRSRVARFVFPRNAGLDEWTLQLGRAGGAVLIPIRQDTAYCYLERRGESHRTESEAEWLAPFRSYADDHACSGRQSG